MSNENREVSYQAIKQQNTTLYNTVQNMSEMYSTDYSKQVFKSTSYENFRYIAGFLFYVYYAVFLIFMILLFFRKDMPWWIRGILVLIFLVYPFGIYYIENFIYQVVAYLAYLV